MLYQFEHFGTSESFSKEIGKNFSFPLHLHRSFELITVTSGEMEVLVDGDLYNLSSGEAILVFPNQIHSLSSQNSEHIVCIFSDELVKAYSNKYSSKVPKNSKFTPNEYLLDTLKLISETSSSFEKKGFLYSICAEFDRDTSYSERTNSDENLLYKIFDFVEKNYRSDCSLEILSKELAFSYSHLSRYFKKITGISFNEYVNKYRISKACYLLSNSDCSVVQCAYDVGYGSLRNFNRNFKAHTDTTPQKYRKS